jgi:hypothetical protein
MRRFRADYHRRLAAGDLSKCEPEGIGCRLAAAREDQSMSFKILLLAPDVDPFWPEKIRRAVPGWWPKRSSIPRTPQRTSSTLMPPTAQCHLSCWRGLQNCAGFARPEPASAVMVLRRAGQG